MTDEAINVFVQVCLTNPLSPWLFFAIYASPDCPPPPKKTTAGFLWMISTRSSLFTKALAAPLIAKEAYLFSTTSLTLAIYLNSASMALGLPGPTKETMALSWSAWTELSLTLNGNSFLKRPMSCTSPEPPWTTTQSSWTLTRPLTIMANAFPHWNYVVQWPFFSKPC